MIPHPADGRLLGASVKLFLPIFKMNFPEIVDIALRGARAPSRVVFGALAKHISVRPTFGRVHSARADRKSVV